MERAMFGVSLKDVKDSIKNETIRQKTSNRHRVENQLVEVVSGLVTCIKGLMTARTYVVI